MSKHSKDENTKDFLQDEDQMIQEGQEQSAAAEEEKSEGQDFEAELAREKDKFLRLFAEFENYKRRTSKERIELFKTAGQDIMVSLLPVLDDFDRALSELGKSADKEVLTGVELISNKFRDILRSKGLEVLEVNPGDAFDADLHEAITQIPSPSEELKGKVIDTVERGYKLGDKIIRHPKVVVGQ